MSHDIDLSEPVDVPVQALDLLLGIREPLPRLASLCLLVVVVGHGFRGVLAAIALLCRAVGPMCPARLLPRLLSKRLEVYRDLELV